MGTFFRRLSSKLACQAVTGRLGNEFAPFQLGVGVPRGCEAAVHGVRAFVERSCASSSSQAIVKLDIQNVFNSVRRDHLIEICESRCPSIYNYVRLSYEFETPLIAGEHILFSKTGVQQGDPLGPVLFSLSIDHNVWTIQCPLNVWYLDDGTIAGNAEEILGCLIKIVPLLTPLDFKSMALNAKPSTLGSPLRSMPPSLNTYVCYFPTPGLLILPLYKSWGHQSFPRATS